MIGWGRGSSGVGVCACEGFARMTAALPAMARRCLLEMVVDVIVCDLFCLVFFMYSFVQVRTVIFFCEESFLVLSDVLDRILAVW